MRLSLNFYKTQTDKLGRTRYRQSDTDRFEDIYINILIFEI